MKDIQLMRDEHGRLRAMKHDMNNVAPEHAPRRISFDAYGNIEGEPMKLHALTGGKNETKCLGFYDFEDKVNVPIFGYLAAVSFTKSKNPYIIRSSANIFFCHTIIPFL